MGPKTKELVGRNYIIALYGGTIMGIRLRHQTLREQVSVVGHVDDDIREEYRRLPRSKKEIDKMAERISELLNDYFNEVWLEGTLEDDFVCRSATVFGEDKELELEIAKANRKLIGKLSHDNKEQAEAMRFLKSEKVQNYLQMLEGKHNNGSNYPPEFWWNYFLSLHF